MMSRNYDSMGKLKTQNSMRREKNSSHGKQKNQGNDEYANKRLSLN